jgi:hypothetical protein
MGPTHAFQSSAFRFGHTFIQGSVRRYNKYHEFVGEDLLRNLLRHPFIVYEPGNYWLKDKVKDKSIHLEM